MDCQNVWPGETKVKKIIYRTYLQSSVAHIEICARVCFLFIHSLEPILFYFMWMADEKRMRMKARWICMFITICTRLLFSSCKLCSSFWLMAAPLVHAHQQIKSWFIASTITHKVAGTYLCNLFQHSAESLLCILWIWIYPHNIYVYHCMSLSQSYVSMIFTSLSLAVSLSLIVCLYYCVSVFSMHMYIAVGETFTFSGICWSFEKIAFDVLRFVLFIRFALRWTPIYIIAKLFVRKSHDSGHVIYLFHIIFLVNFYIVYVFKCVCARECTFFFYFSLFLHENFILSFCWTHFYRSRCHRCSHFSALLHTAIEWTNSHTEKFKIYHHIKWHVYGQCVQCACIRTNCTENHNKIFSINI